MISDNDTDRYSRQIMLDQIGLKGQESLKNATVCLVGVGGLGNLIAKSLVAMGVGKIRIVDRDVIERSNLPRQTLYNDKDIGSVKVEAAERHLLELNPSCDIEPMAVSIIPETAQEAIEGCDVVIDALDNVDARHALNRACIMLDIPLVTGAAVGTIGQVMTVKPRHSPCYYCLFSGVDGKLMPSCGLTGVHPSILSIIAGIQVSEAVNVLIGKEPNLVGNRLYVDISTLDFIKISSNRVENCAVCGTMAKPMDPTKKILVESICARSGGKRTWAISPSSKYKFDLEMAKTISRDLGYNVESIGRMGTVISKDGMTATFLDRGFTLVEGGLESSKEAEEFYHTITGNHAEDGIED